MLAVGVMLFGVVFINRGLVATGAPVTFTTVKTALLGAPTAQPTYTTAADGVVEVPITIENTQFVPQVVQIPADTPVRLVVDRQGSRRVLGPDLPAATQHPCRPGAQCA